MPTLISTLPPVLYVSLFSTEFNIGSTFSTSYTNNGHPNLKLVSNVLINDSSVNDVLDNFLSLNNEDINDNA